MKCILLVVAGGELDDDDPPPPPALRKMERRVLWAVGHLSPQPRSRRACFLGLADKTVLKAVDLDIVNTVSTRLVLCKVGVRPPQEKR